MTDRERKVREALGKVWPEKVTDDNVDAILVYMDGCDHLGIYVPAVDAVQAQVASWEAEE